MCSGSLWHDWDKWHLVSVTYQTKPVFGQWVTWVGDDNPYVVKAQRQQRECKRCGIVKVKE